LFVANHGSGNVAAIPLTRDGRLEAVRSSQRDDTVGTEQRQHSPSAHAAVADPSHQYVLVNYFSADRVSVYRIDAKNQTLTPAATLFAPFPPASGPRHLVFDPTGRFVYVNNEISGAIQSFRWDAKRGQLSALQHLSAYPEDYTGRRSAAEIAVSPNGRFLYMSLRGDQHSIVAYAIDKRAGTLTEIQRIPSQGKLPWSFGIDPSGQWLLVANSGSNVVSVLQIDPVTGLLAPTNESWSIPAGPVAIAFFAH
jgi:6-phosphogluconolactonase